MFHRQQKHNLDESVYNNASYFTTEVYIKNLVYCLFNHTHFQEILSLPDRIHTIHNFHIHKFLKYLTSVNVNVSL